MPLEVGITTMVIILQTAGDVKVGLNDGGAATAVVVSASSGVGSGKVKVARAQMKPIYGGSKRSRISAPEGVSEENWMSMTRQQRKNWRSRHQTDPLP